MISQRVPSGTLVAPDKIVEHLPGEPRRERAGPVLFSVRIVAELVLISVLVCVSLVLLPLFLLGLLTWGWPPHLPRVSQSARHLRRAWHARVPAPGLPPLSRLWIVLRIVEKTASVPVRGLAWYLDELLFGRQLNTLEMRAPIFLLSAARSGSTQLGHYIEEDPRVVAPVMLQIVFPYLWLWHLVVPTLGRLISPETLSGWFDAAVPLEMKQRHEGHPLRTDTVEVLWMMHGLLLLSAFLGPGPMGDDLTFLGTAPENRRLWEEDFVDFMERVGRKALLFAGPLPGGGTPRLFVKGHFLEARGAVARRWQDARFLTVVRDPVKRIESMVNHLHANAVEEALGAVPWAWITPMVVQAGIDYCHTEQAWYSRPGHPQRLVVPFTDYVHDLPGTMHRVYCALFDEDELPPHVPREHPPRERTNYLVHRTLVSLGVDVDALREQTAGYAAWCHPPPAEPVAEPA